MGETIFNFTLRTIECSGCGAPVTGTISGGQVRCQYCGAQMIITARHHEQREATRIDEASRLAGLRAQLGAFDSEKALIREPDELAPFRAMLADPASAKAGEEGYRQEWERARKRLAAGQAGPESATHLFRVALAVSEHHARSDAMRARAVLETAIDLLEDGDLRDVLRCRLARYALFMGDVEAGAAWLAEVDTRPLRLEVDTEVRLSRALLAFRQQRHDDVLELLGRDAETIPMRLAHGGLLPWALRAHALAGRGELGAAIRLLRGVAMNYDFGNNAEVQALFSALPGPLSLLAARRAMASGNRRVAGILGGGALFVFAAIFVPCCVPPACPIVGCNGSYAAVIEALERCPETRALLGEGVTWAVGCSEGEGSCDSLDWKMPVKGSKARGTVRFSVSRSGERWRVSGTLHTDAGSANICSEYQTWERGGATR